MSQKSPLSRYRWILAVLLACGLAGCGAVPVDEGFQKAQKQLESEVIPGYCAVYKVGASKLRADTPTAERQEAAKQILSLLKARVEATNPVEEAFKKPGDSSYATFQSTCETLAEAWKHEAEVYSLFATAMLLPDPRKDPNLASVIGQLQGVAVDRVKATRAAQEAYDKLPGSQRKQLTRPQTVDPFQ